MMFGAHMSIAGGFEKALVRGESIGCQVIQIFTKNNLQWKAKKITKKECDGFHSLSKKLKIKQAIAHDSYLINLASPSPDQYSKSIEAFFDEVERCEMLQIPFLVFHPGSHSGSGEREGLKKIAQSINLIKKKKRGFNVSLLLETTAGQGSNLGYKFEHLAEIIKRVGEKESLGVCLDTCHIFAAGYDITTERGYHKTFEIFDKLIGLDKVKAIHLNDSKRELGSRVDRHEHIGKGFMGLEPFRLLVNDNRFTGVPKILETPKGSDLKEDIENLRILRSLIK
jgi:deoxyribonuclease-4